jgi:uncharacterized membrane protein YeiH
MDLMIFLPFFDMIGIMAFATTGALVAGQHRMDLFGGLILAAVTGVGGGTIRDLILDVPVFWIADHRPLWACLAGLVIALYFLRRRSVISNHINMLIQGLDALGLALFTVIGAHKAMMIQGGIAIPVIMGGITGVGGGLIRDVLANRIPLVLSRIRFYATASLLGAVIFACLWPYHPVLAMVMGFAVTLFFRVGALVYNWRLPMFPLHDGGAD